MTNLIIPILAFLLGYFVHMAIGMIMENIKRKQGKKLVQSYFSEIKTEIERGNSHFLSRVNNLILLSTNLKDFGDVVVAYTLEPREVSIIKDKKQILTTNEIDLKSTIGLTQTIEKIHKNKIEDVIDVLGTIYSREEFEKSIQDTMSLFKGENQIESSKNVIKTDNTPLNIDDILDKINKVGIENLTNEEKEFLKRYK